MFELFLSWLQNNWYEVITGLVGLPFFVAFLAKYIRVRLLVNDLLQYIQIRRDSDANGTVTDAEWIERGKYADKLIMDIYRQLKGILGVIKGLFPNKSRVV